MSNICNNVHHIFQNLKRYKFPFNEEELPKNGIYILFERNELAHNGERIVRVGTHTGNDNLAKRLKEHFIKENKDRSIFRKNIGRAILSKKNDSFLEQWNWDLTTRVNRDRYSSLVNFEGILVECFLMFGVGFFHSLTEYLDFSNVIRLK